MEHDRRHTNEADSTATSLLQRLRRSNGNKDAWHRLSELYGPVVYGWARRAGLQPHDAADVMQEVFQSLTSHLVRFRKRNEKDSFRGWLWTITRNKVRDHYRRLKNGEQAIGGTSAHQHLQALAEQPPQVETEEGTVELSGIRRLALQLAQGDFEPRTWQAFWRAAVEGDAPADVAADLGISVWAVYKARSRVLQRLREEFADLI